MHQDLNDWLDDVWKKRKEIVAASKVAGFIRGRGASYQMNPGTMMIYRMYSGSGAASEVKTSYLKAMKGELVQLEREIGTPPEAQGVEEWVNWSKGDMAKAESKDLTNKFFHYRHNNRQSVYRIYVNANIATRGKLFREIVSSLWSLDSLSNAKVDTSDGRADTIVIYLETKIATENALASIAKYHRKNPNLFGSALPKLVVPADYKGYQMRGVGTAMEPPTFAVISTGGEFFRRDEMQSFGGYRSRLIFMALERTRWEVKGQSGQERQTAFKNRVEKYFRRAGIDPNRPAEQGAVEDLPPIATIQDWANKTDGSFV
jgi:hypothetical protein